MKTFAVHILTDAVNDMQEGRRFYERQDPVLGNYFWDSITADLESLQIYGGIHSKKLGFFRMVAKRFPYAIYYDITEETVIVVAILPMRKKPETIADSLQNR